MGLVLILVSFLLGYCIIRDFVLIIKRPVIIITGAFLIGSLISGTLLYLMDMLFVYLFNSVLISSLVFISMSGVYIYCRRNLLPRLKEDFASVVEKGRMPYIILSIICFSTWLCYHTLSLKNGSIVTSGGGICDLIFHHAFVRSVGIGSNIPVQYPYYPNSAMHYHFMFDYYAGKLSQFSLNSVHMFNILSILSLSSFLILIIEFCRFYFKSAVIGVISVALLIFHSSVSGFVWAMNNLGHDLPNKIVNRHGWLDNATFEGWGLFNLNIFLSQRHTAFSLGIVLFIVIYALHLRDSKSQSPEGSVFNAADIKRNILVALIIGMMPFWNAVMAGLSILILAGFSVMNLKKRKFSICLIITVLLAGIVIYPQLQMFKSGDTVLSQFPRFHPGYAVDPFTLKDFGIYYFKVLGIKLLLIISAFFVVSRRKKADFLIFMIPFVLANLMQFGYVLFDNNKLLILWLVFMNCFAAYVIHELFIVKGWVLKTVPLVLIAAVTFSGALDFISVVNMRFNPLADETSELKKWVVDTPRNSVFLVNPEMPSEDSSAASIILGGRKLYMIENYMDSMVNLDYRGSRIKEIYEFQGGVEEVRKKLHDEKINFIVIDNLVLASEQFKVKAEEFDRYFKIAYKKDNLRVYSVN